MVWIFLNVAATSTNLAASTTRSAEDWAVVCMYLDGEEAAGQLEGEREREGERE